jgi:hypothetical protein
MKAVRVRTTQAVPAARAGPVTGRVAAAPRRVASRSVRVAAGRGATVPPARTDEVSPVAEPADTPNHATTPAVRERRVAHGPSVETSRRRPTETAHAVTEASARTANATTQVVRHAAAPSRARTRRDARLVHRVRVAATTTVHAADARPADARAPTANAAAEASSAARGPAVPPAREGTALRVRARTEGAPRRVSAVAVVVTRAAMTPPVGAALRVVKGTSAPRKANVAVAVTHVAMGRVGAALRVVRGPSGPRRVSAVVAVTRVGTARQVEVALRVVRATSAPRRVSVAVAVIRVATAPAGVDLRAKEPGVGGRLSVATLPRAVRRVVRARGALPPEAGAGTVAPRAASPSSAAAGRTSATAARRTSRGRGATLAPRFQTT